MHEVHDVYDEFKHQLPDIDPEETQEWIESLDALVKESGGDRARFVLYKLLKRARRAGKSAGAGGRRGGRARPVPGGRATGAAARGVRGGGGGQSATNIPSPAASTRSTSKRPRATVGLAPSLGVA